MNTISCTSIWQYNVVVQNFAVRYIWHLYKKVRPNE